MPLCSLKSGGVSAATAVPDEFDVPPAKRLEILQRYSRVAMVGLSANPYRPSHFAAKYLKHKGFQITPVHPKEDRILGLKCYPTLTAIPHPIEIVDIFRPSETVGPLVEQAIAIGAKVVWMQFGVINTEAARAAREAGLEVVMDACMKVEHARFFGGLRTLGLNTGVLSSRRWSPLDGRKDSPKEPSAERS